MTAPQQPGLHGDVRFPVLGLDISETKIGLAIAESPDAAPRPLYTYRRVTRERDLAQCAEWVQRYGVGGVVLGLPLNMDGTPGPRAQWMRRFGRGLQEKVEAPVLFQDERLSTFEAEEFLMERGMPRGEREEMVDAVAAALILERFLHHE